MDGHKNKVARNIFVGFIYKYIYFIFIYLFIMILWYSKYAQSMPSTLDFWLFFLFMHLQIICKFFMNTKWLLCVFCDIPLYNIHVFFFHSIKNKHSDLSRIFCTTLPWAWARPCAYSREAPFYSSDLIEIYFSSQFAN